MTQIEVFDDIASSLSAQAAAQGCSQAELASSLLRQGLDLQYGATLSSDEESVLLNRLSDSEGSAFATSEEVDAKFSALFADLRAQ